MTRRHLYGLPLGILGMAILIALVLSMTGTQPSPVDRDGNALNDAMLNDINAIAKAEGISNQAAVDNYAWHNDFALMVSDVRASSPGGFTAGGISGDSAAWVAFAGAVPQEASGHIGRFRGQYPSVNVETISDAGFTEAESSAALQAAHYAVMNSPDVTDAGSSFDFQSRKIDITANVGTDSPPGSLVPGLRKSAETAVTNATKPDMLDYISVSVVGSDSPTGGTDSNDKHWGGEALSHCTSGFPVVNSSGTRGISTAGHCVRDMTDDGDTLTWKKEHVGSAGDLQWHTGPEDVTNKFYAGSSSSSETNLRSVTDTNTPVYRQYLCRNGKNSSRDCQRVRKVEVCQNYVCNLGQFYSYLGARGDSGGPVYNYYTAYGIHHGWMDDPEDYRREVFSRLDQINSAIKVNILTTN